MYTHYSFDCMEELVEHGCHFLQVSVGTLLAFTIVAVSVLILRYIPPNEMPLPSSLQDSVDPLFLPYHKSAEDLDRKDPEMASTKDSARPLLEKADSSVDIPIIGSYLARCGCKFHGCSYFSILSVTMRLFMVSQLISTLSRFFSPPIWSYNFTRHL